MVTTQVQRSFTRNENPASIGRRVSDISKLGLIAVSRKISSHFPRPVSETKVVLMEVSPYKLHVYWNVQPSVMNRLRKTGGYR